MRLLFLFLSLIACDIKNVKDDSVIAKVGDYELRNSDLINILPTNISEIDSTQLVEKYIRNWITNKSLFDKAEINLTESEINEIKNSTNKYYEELIIDKYRSKLLINNYDTIIDYDEIQNYYKELNKIDIFHTSSKQDISQREVYMKMFEKSKNALKIIKCAKL